MRVVFCIKLQPAISLRRAYGRLVFCVLIIGSMLCYISVSLLLPPSDFNDLKFEFCHMRFIGSMLCYVVQLPYFFLGIYLIILLQNMFLV